MTRKAYRSNDAGVAAGLGGSGVRRGRVAVIMVGDSLKRFGAYDITRVRGDWDLASWGVGAVSSRPACQSRPQALRARICLHPHGSESPSRRKTKSAHSQVSP